MTDTMRERVARALAKHLEDDDPDQVGLYPTAVRGKYEQHPVWTEFLPAADAAIAAMREPTEEMLACEAVDMIDAAPSDCKKEATVIYQGMIDAELNETNETEPSQ